MKAKFRLWLIAALLAAAAAVFIAVPQFYPGDDLAFNTEVAEPFNTGWTYHCEDGTKEAFSLPHKLSVEPNAEFAVSARLPDNLVEGMSLCVRTSHQSISAEIAGKTIYSRGVSGDVYLGKTEGNSWNLIRIPDEAAGKEIVLRLRSPYAEYSGLVNEIYYGSKSALMFRIAQIYLPGFLIAVFILLLGLILFLLHFVINKRFENKRDFSLLYLSLSAALAALWLLGESRMLQFFSGNQFFITQISYVALSLFPVPLVLYIGQLLHKRYRRVADILAVLLSLSFAAITVLQLTDVADFYQTLILTHSLIIASAVILPILLGIEAARHNNREAKLVEIGLIVLIIFGLTELGIFYFANAMYNSTFLCVGFLVFIFILGVTKVRNLQTIAEKGREARYYERLAYEDTLTRGKNRGAYFKSVEGLFGNAQAPENLRLVLFDLNDLKKINDSLGHLEGDTALVLCYSCISGAFGEENTYRIGGDEFACILHGQSEAEFQRQCLRFRNLVDEAAKTARNYDFDVAMGWAVFDPGLDKSFDDLSMRADARLYEDKALLKSLRSN